MYLLINFDFTNYNMLFSYYEIKTYNIRKAFHSTKILFTMFGIF